MSTWDEPLESGVDDGGPIYARPVGSASWQSGAPFNGPQKGMSLRDHIATEVMVVMVARIAAGHGLNVTEAAKTAYAIADAMLLARKGVPQE